MSKPDFVVVRDQQILHTTDSLAGAAAFAGDVYGSTVYERVEIEDAEERFDRMVERMRGEMRLARKGGAA